MLVQTHGTLQFKKPAAPPVTDSITLTPSTVNFDTDGNPTSSDEIYVEATGYWYTAPLDIGDGIFSYADPGSNTGNGYTYIFCEYNDLGYSRYGRIRFYCGSAQADLEIYQY